MCVCVCARVRVCVCVSVPWASAHACTSALGTWVCCDVREDHMCLYVHAWGCRHTTHVYVDMRVSEAHAGTARPPHLPPRAEARWPQGPLGLTLHPQKVLGAPTPQGVVL